MTRRPVKCDGIVSLQIRARSELGIIAKRGPFYISITIKGTRRPQALGPRLRAGLLLPSPRLRAADLPSCDD